MKKNVSIHCQIDSGIRNRYGTVLQRIGFGVQVSKNLACFIDLVFLGTKKNLKHIFLFKFLMCLSATHCFCRYNEELQRVSTSVFGKWWECVWLFASRNWSYSSKSKWISDNGCIEENYRFTPSLNMPILIIHHTSTKTQVLCRLNVYLYLSDKRNY